MVRAFLDGSGNVGAVERFRLGMADLADACHVPRGPCSKHRSSVWWDRLVKNFTVALDAARRLELADHHRSGPDHVGVSRQSVPGVDGSRHVDSPLVVFDLMWYIFRRIAMFGTRIWSIHAFGVKPPETKIVDEAMIRAPDHIDATVPVTGWRVVSEESC